MGLLPHQRNDIPFLHAAQIPPHRLLSLFKVKNSRPSAPENQWIQQNQVTYFSTHVIPEAPNRQWKSTPHLQKELNAFYALYLKTIGECRAHNKKNKTNKTNKINYTPWFLEHLWDMGAKTAYWKDFYYTNNIRMIVNQVPSADNFIPALAISQMGGMIIEFERSIRFDYCTYIHNGFNHVNFITGPYSITQIPEPSFSLSTLQAGGVNINASEKGIEGFQKLKESAKYIIAVFDENPNDVFFGESVRQMYQAMIRLVKEDPRFSLLIKSKKPLVLERFGGVKEQLDELTRQNRCLMAGWKERISTAAACSDIVVAMPSTATFESVLIGTRTIVFNPMKAGSNLFYTNNGLNRRVFESGEPLVRKLKEFADGRDDSVGDCRDLVSQIDPFNDSCGAKRIGEYINQCLDDFDSGLQSLEITQKNNLQFAERYGKDKLTTENAYETTHTIPAN